MITPYDLRSTVGLYHYTRWVQNCVTLLRPHLRPESLTPDTLLTLCECACAARNHSVAQVHAVPEADLPMAQDYFRTVAAQELQTPW
jgi:hypothetical protein